jgi:hypothetical protein
MAENKKSVLLYCDIIHTVKSLTNDEAGKLFKHYLEYINDLNPESDRLTELLFEPIKQNLKRDLKKWESISERNSLIAKEGWVKRKYANASERNKAYAKNADKDKVIVKVNDKVIVKDIYRAFNHLSISNEEIEFLRLQGYSTFEIDSILDAIENYKKNKNYISLYLTAKKWLEKEKSSAKKEINGKQFNSKPSKADAIIEGGQRITDAIDNGLLDGIK